MRREKTAVFLLPNTKLCIWPAITSSLNIDTARKTVKYHGRCRSGGGLEINLLIVFVQRGVGGGGGEGVVHPYGVFYSQIPSLGWVVSAQ